MSKAKPIYTAKCGAVTIKVLRNGVGRFCIAWRPFAGAPRRRETFGEKAAALKRADEIAKAIADGQAESVTLTGLDRASWHRIVKLCAPLGIPPATLVEDAAAARVLVGGPLKIAAEEYVAARALLREGETVLGTVRAAAAARVSAEDTSVPTLAMVEGLIARARDDRRDERRYIEPLQRDLERFAKAVPDLRAASEQEVRAYLRGLVTTKRSKQAARGEPVSARRRDNVRDAIVTLYRYAVDLGRLPAGMTVAEKIPRLAEGGEVTTYAPEQLAQVLGYFEANDRAWLPWAALGAFAGLRTSEIFRLRWEKIKWATASISVPATVARKVKDARMVPMADNLAAWLEPWRHASGPVIVAREGKSMDNEQGAALMRMRTALGWTSWDTNALRHSFGSNRLALVKDFGRVAFEMGNSPGQIRRWYHDPKSEPEARAYFALVPPWRAENVTPLPVTA